MKNLEKNDVCVIQAAEILESGYKVLSQQQCLSPKNEVVNDTLGFTICQICRWQSLGYGQCLLQNEKLSLIKEDLPLLCSRAETELELYWSNLFSTYKSLSWDILQEFWYYNDYVDVVESEIKLLKDTAKNYANLSFIGGGSLPMTVFITAKKLPQFKFHCVDWDINACHTAQDLIDKMNLQDRISVIHASAQSYIPPDDYIPLIASLIEDKPSVYNFYQRQGIKTFMVRDAEDIYEFIYRPAEIPNETYWYHRGKTPLSSKRLNTTRLYSLK